jgi:site-specific DNA recombinase
VIGEYERAFFGGQYSSTAPLSEHEIGLWMPEVGGRVDSAAEDHEQTMMALGLQSKREITRTRIRVRTAMATQTPRARSLPRRPAAVWVPARRRGAAPEQGPRRRGRRAHRLGPDPETAPVARWILVAAALGMNPEGIMIYLADHLYDGLAARSAGPATGPARPECS